MPHPPLCVVGSSNLDLNAYVHRFPAPGETIHGQRFTTGYGGKGANQAVMAARLGGAVTLVAKIGQDLFGRDMQENFRREGINTDHLYFTDDVATGVAVITVDGAGMNQIIVIPGANGALTPQEVERARATIEAAHVLVCQLEIPLTANLAAMRLARAAGVPILFNPAPVDPDLPDELFALCDILCPNEHEAQLLTGLPVRDLAEAEAAARRLLGRGPRHVIITLGERGSLLVDGESTQHVPAPQVKAVDTTGAGDAFVGSLAFFLGQGVSLVEAMRRANAIAAHSVQFPGTQSSYPRAAALPSELLAV
jgi:ribokinase